MAVADSEAYQTLLTRAQRRTGGLPAETIVRHVLAVTRGGDWPVQRDALDAVLRRCASAHSDDVQVVGRPRGRPLGLYQTRRRGSRARPYRTMLRRIEPIEGSCECPDFLRSSLGLCKHLVAVLEEVGPKRARIEMAHASIPDLTPWRWDPVRPLTGPGDWLARVRWMGGTPDRDLRAWLHRTQGGSPAGTSSTSGRSAAVRSRRPNARSRSKPGDLRRNLAEAVAKTGSPTSESAEDGWTVIVPEASRQRLALVERLLAALQHGDVEPALHALLQEERARLAPNASSRRRSLSQRRTAPTQVCQRRTPPSAKWMP
jgi:hypothetical protein